MPRCLIILRVCVCVHFDGLVSGLIPPALHGVGILLGFGSGFGTCSSALRSLARSLAKGADGCWAGVWVSGIMSSPFREGKGFGLLLLIFLHGWGLE